MDNQSRESTDNDCAAGRCGCDGSLDRRTFIQFAGAGALGLLASRMQAMAGPFEASDFEKLVPSDKKLRPEWIKSLFERGNPES
jgi:hypothetical protein